MNDPPNGIIDPADHPKVGAHVGLVFFRSIPAPEVALAVQRSLEKLRLTGKNRGIIQAWRRNYHILIHAVRRGRPGEMPLTRSEVTIFRMSGIKTDRQAEWLLFRIAVDEGNRLIRAKIRFMAQRPVFLLFEKGVPIDCLELVKEFLRREFP